VLELFIGVIIGMAIGYLFCAIGVMTFTKNNTAATRFRPWAGQDAGGEPGRQFL